MYYFAMDAACTGWFIWRDDGLTAERMFGPFDPENVFYAMALLKELSCANTN